MPGASGQTRRVKIVNANWVAGPDGDHGRFEVMMVTERYRPWRGAHHGLRPMPQ
jgi:hypothetical protein